MLPWHVSHGIHGIHGPPHPSRNYVPPPNRLEKNGDGKGAYKNIHLTGYLGWS